MARKYGRDPSGGLRQRSRPQDDDAHRIVRKPKSTGKIAYATMSSGRRQRRKQQRGAVPPPVHNQSQQLPGSMKLNRPLQIQRQGVWKQSRRTARSGCATNADGALKFAASTIQPRSIGLRGRVTYPPWDNGKAPALVVGSRIRKLEKE